MLECQGQGNITRLREIIHGAFVDKRLHVENKHIYQVLQRVFQLVKERNVIEKMSKNQFHKMDNQELSEDEVKLLLELSQNRHVT